MTNFQFLVAARSDPSDGGPSSGASEQLETAFRFFRAAGIPIASRNQTLGPYVYYVGQTAVGEVALLVETNIKSKFSDLLAIDPESGKSRLIAGGFSVFDTAPVLSMDGSRLYILRRHARRLDILDSGSGKIIGRVNDLPRLVSRVVDGQSGNYLYLLTGLGGVYRADLSFHADLSFNRLEGPIVQIPGATSLAASGDGMKLYVIGADLESIVMVDLAAGYSQRMAPLVDSAYWIWADPDGLFLFVGSARGAEVTIIHAESLDIAGRLDFSKDAD